MVVPGGVDQIYTSFSTQDAFLALVAQSPSTYTIEVVDKDTVTLNPESLEYHDGPVSDPLEENCERLHFKLMEKVKYFGISILVEVLGTQVMSERAKIHIYESSANNGKVNIYKVRKFLPEGESHTRIEERIDGKTSWMLSGFVGRECRRAHATHVSRYGNLVT